MGVQFRTNANHIAARQRERAAKVDAAMKAGSAAWGQGVMRRAVALSQGPLKTAMLRQYRPGLYSTASPSNPAFDAVINSQTGLFARSWRVSTWGYSGHVTTTVYNVAPYSGFMMGTARMRFRGVLEAAVNGRPGQVAAVVRPSTFTRTIHASKVMAEGSGYGAASFVGELVQIGVGVVAAYAGELM